MSQYNVIQFETNKFAELRRRILEAEPDIDERTLHDTLDGATDLREAIAETIRSALQDGAMADALRKRIGDLKERLSRIETREERKREAARIAMEEAGIDRLVEPDVTISLRHAPPGLAIIDERQIPEWFWMPQPSKLDKKGLLEALKGGSAICGAALENSKLTLSVRTK